MELRSKLKSLLIDKLKCAGVYEEDMAIEEMRELAQVMEISETAELDRVLMESEIDFQLTVNSTMIVEQPATEPPLDASNEASVGSESPPMMAIRMLVRAEVHHELDWSPEKPTRLSKREGAVPRADSVDIKRRRQYCDDDATPISFSATDSGHIDDEIGTLSSISDTSTIPSIGEIPSLHLISTSSAAVSEFSNSDESHDCTNDSNP